MKALFSEFKLENEQHTYYVPLTNKQIQHEDN